MELAYTSEFGGGSRKPEGDCLRGLLLFKICEIFPPPPFGLRLARVPKANMQTANGTGSGKKIHTKRQELSVHFSKAGIYFLLFVYHKNTHCS